MANQKDISSTYDAWEVLFVRAMKRTFGRNAPLDITGARYLGDFSKTYGEAQKSKQNYILEKVGFEEGDSVLDVGSGWGPMLKKIKDAEGNPTGLTLSTAQLKYCKENGFNAQLIDWKEFSSLKGNADIKDLNREQPFDAIISVGSFEHFCSIEEYQEGKQDEIYQEFFKTMHHGLKPEGKFYLQTMTFGKRFAEKGGFPDVVSEIDPKSSEYSTERLLGHMRELFPGSFLPSSQEQIIQAATPYFKLLESEDGVRDYIETARVWGEALYRDLKARGIFGKCIDYMKFLIKGAGRPGGRDRLNAVLENSLLQVFAHDLFGHKRLTFQRR